MDGVTDAPMRFVAKKYGKQHLSYTEFVSADGMWRLSKKGEMGHKIWNELKYDPIERPVIAQIFGSDPEAFFESAKIIKEMGFDGVDINMGCPSPGLERRGGGAGLIRDKCNAKEVIEATRKGAGGLPVSVKTRIGSKEFDQSWWEFLASMKLPAVAMHGRTFKQLYSGDADWDRLLLAAEIIRESGAKFLGNGDVVGVKDGVVAVLKNGREIDMTGKVDGVLIGREAIGNPWALIPDGGQPSIEQRLRVSVEHSKKFEELFPETRFFPMRKHLVKYAHGFEGAVDLRKKLVMAESAEDVKKAVDAFTS